MPFFAGNAQNGTAFSLHVHDLGAACVRLVRRCRSFRGAAVSGQFWFTSETTPEDNVCHLRACLLQDTTSTHAYAQAKHKRHAHNNAPVLMHAPPNAQAGRWWQLANAAQLLKLQSRACLAPHVPSCGAKSSAGRARKRHQ